MNCSSLYRVFIENKGDHSGNYQGQKATDGTEKYAAHGIAFSADEIDQSQNRGSAAHRIAFDPCDAAEQARDSSADNCADHRLDIAEVNAVHSGFSNTSYKGGDAAGDALGTGFLVLRFQCHTESSAALGNVGAEHGNYHKDIKAEGHHIVHGKRHQCVVHSSHDNEGHQGRQYTDRQPGYCIIHGQKHPGEYVANDVANGAKHIE